MTSSLAFMPNIGPLEVAIVLVILLIIFGPKRIPAAFRSIGEAFRGFRDTVGGGEEDEKEPAALVESSGGEGGESGRGETASGTGDKAGTKTEA
jgi:sec-independent protein translocase protein TatA